MKRMLCLWFPNWPIQRLVVVEPSLRKTHLVLFRRDSRKGQLVAAASPLAMQSGIQLDMPISEVKQLLRHAGRTRQTYHPSHLLHPRTQHHQLAKESGVGLRTAGVSSTQAESLGHLASKTTHRKPQTENQFYILEHDPVADREALEKLVDSLHCFSPIVGIEQTEAPESCFLDVTGLDSLFGDEQTLRAKAVRFLGDAGYTVFSSIANTPGMAWGMAHYHRSAAPAIRESHSSETLVREFRQLPVAALRLSTETQHTFSRLGVERVEQLLAIPRTHLASRFGDEVSTRIDQAFGKVVEPVVARHLPAEFEASQFIEFPTRDRETIGVILSRLLEQICKQLQSSQKGALQWRVQLDCVDAPSIEFEVNLFQPTATVSHVLQLMELQLESVLQPHLRRKRFKKAKDKKPVRTRTVTNILIQEITVRVTSCVLLVHRQRELFDESPRLDKQELAHLINHLTGRLGQESIVYPTLQAGAQPELSFRFKPLVDPKRMRSRKKQDVKSRSHRLAWPLRLLDPPIEISNGNSEIESRKNQMPSSFLHQRLRHYVSRVWGPERIETAWWHGPTVRRDYWRVETESGQHFWVYFDLKTGRWFLQGEF
ncbi:Y-family DNA polymerase [Mariniblastus fucicola]|uniref:DNA polymerase IV n=1 Tax=Mariniblastus fucicola TaxID=980251 RepID=A0A5B9PF36_9BACT|nr:DNA polymerase Y family protein [Mariniblastus fucicola]QEG23790.1 DNA polymerase IV [Mariniblastus fucicola]